LVAGGEYSAAASSSLSSSSAFHPSSNNNNNPESRSGSHIRERRPSRSPITTPGQRFGGGVMETSSSNISSASAAMEASGTPYTRLQDTARTRSGNTNMGDNHSATGGSYQNSTLSGATATTTSNNSSSAAGAASNRSLHSLRRSYLIEKTAREATGTLTSDHPPLLEIPEQIYGIRKAALQVLKPLTRTWVSYIRGIVRGIVTSPFCLNYLNALNTHE
jgi:hypothetical protein